MFKIKYLSFNLGELRSTHELLNAMKKLRLNKRNWLKMRKTLIEYGIQKYENISCSVNLNITGLNFETNILSIRHIIFTKITVIFSPFRAFSMHYMTVANFNKYERTNKIEKNEEKQQQMDKQFPTA